MEALGTMFSAALFILVYSASVIGTDLIDIMNTSKNDVSSNYSIQPADWNLTIVVGSISGNATRLTNELLLADVMLPQSFSADEMNVYDGAEVEIFQVRKICPLASGEKILQLLSSVQPNCEGTTLSCDQTNHCDINIHGIRKKRSSGALVDNGRKNDKPKRATTKPKNIIGEMASRTGLSNGIGSTKSFNTSMPITTLKSTPPVLTTPESKPPDLTPPESPPLDSATPGTTTPPNSTTPDSTPTDSTPTDSTPPDSTPPDSTPTESTPPDSTTPPNSTTPDSTPPDSTTPLHSAAPVSTTPESTTPPDSTTSDSMTPKTDEKSAINETPTTATASKPSNLEVFAPIFTQNENSTTSISILPGEPSPLIALWSMLPIAVILIFAVVVYMIRTRRLATKLYHPNDDANDIMLDDYRNVNCNHPC